MGLKFFHKKQKPSKTWLLLDRGHPNPCIFDFRISELYCKYTYIIRLKQNIVAYLKQKNAEHQGLRFSISFERKMNFRQIYYNWNSKSIMKPIRIQT